MLASVSVLGRAELGSFGVVICVGIDTFIVSFTVQFACLCDNDFCLSNAGVVVSGFEQHIKSVCVCVKAFVCQSVCVSKCVCVKAPCVKAFVRKRFCVYFDRTTWNC